MSVLCTLFRLVDLVTLCVSRIARVVSQSVTLVSAYRSSYKWNATYKSSIRLS